MNDTRSRDNTIWNTPLSVLLRGRLGPAKLGQRHDPLLPVKESSLPDPAKALITKVVTKTRLWKHEKQEIAEELLAHFADGLEAGRSIEELIATFGDSAKAAKLMRRAKQRNRPLLWRMWIRATQAACCFVVVYVAAALLLLVSHPVPSVDYVAQVNATAASAPAADRAWPIYRDVFIELDKISGDDLRQLTGQGEDSRPNEVRHPGDATWPAAVALVRQHEAMLAKLRQAAAKPYFGLVVGNASSFSEEDRAALSAPKPPPAAPDQGTVDELLQDASISILLPHLAKMRELALMLQVDAMDVSTRSDGQRVVNDYSALIRVARHVREHPTLISQLVCVGICLRADEMVAWVNLHHPQAIAAHRVSLLHAAAGAHDLYAIDITTEHGFVLDMLQRMYSDSGNGDGHLTPAGLQVLSALSSEPRQYPFSIASRRLNGWLVAPLAATVTASRQDATSVAEHYFELARQELAEPLWVRLRHAPQADSYIKALLASTSNRLYYAPLAPILPTVSRAGTRMDIARATHEALMVTLALEVCRQRTGSYPDTLGQLVSQYLPQLPVDLSTGQPLLYKLKDGKPLLYGRGLDSDDDGGVWVPGRRETWPNVPSEGDWVLYPEPVEPDLSTR